MGIYCKLKRDVRVKGVGVERWKAQERHPPNRQKHVEMDEIPNCMKILEGMVLVARLYVYKSPFESTTISVSTGVTKTSKVSRVTFFWDYCWIVFIQNLFKHAIANIQEYLSYNKRICTQLSSAIR